MPYADMSLIRGRNFANVFLIDDSDDLGGVDELLKRHGIGIQYYNDDEYFLDSDHAGRTGCLLVSGMSPDKAMSRLSLIQELRPVGQRIAPILVIQPNDVRLAFRAVRMGAFDVLESPFDDDLLLTKLHEAFAALMSAPAPIAAMGRKIDRRAAQAARASLTERQREILDRIVLGQPNKIIAADLGISQRTAENHRAAIMRKMGASSASGLIQIALAA